MLRCGTRSRPPLAPDHRQSTSTHTTSARPMLSCIRAYTRTFWRRQRPKMARGFAVRQVSNEGWEYEPVDVSGHGVEEERIRGYRLKKVGNPIQARACVHTCKAGNKWKQARTQAPTRKLYAAARVVAHALTPVLAPTEVLTCSHTWICASTAAAACAEGEYG